MRGQRTEDKEEGLEKKRRRNGEDTVRCEEDGDKEEDLRREG